MLPALLLALREGIEIALIIGVVYGTLNRLKRLDLKKFLWYGAASAAALSVILAVILNWIGAEFSGIGEQIFEGSTMIVAAVLLSWMIFWMRRENSNMRSSIESNVRQAVTGPGKFELFMLAFSGVFREGVELVLYLLAARFTSAPLQTISGAVVGLIIAAVLGWSLFASSLRLNLNKFFVVTNIFLILFAAGLVGRAIHEFNEAALMPAGIESMYNLTPVLSEDSAVGQILTALIGYSSAPSLTMVIGYIAYLVVVVAMIRAQPQHVRPTPI